MNNEEEDKIIRDITFKSFSFVAGMADDTPTVISLQDTVDLIDRKYGKYWRNYSQCKAVVIWASSKFTLEHVKEVVPDLFDLCKEYQEKGTLNGKEFPSNFYMLAFHIIDPSMDILPE